MAKTKSEEIYEQIRGNIENGKYQFLGKLPSEHRLTAMYSCSRTTVRKAISYLVQEGYVQTVHGRGVQVIYKPYTRMEFPAFHSKNLRKYLRGEEKRLKHRLLRFEELKAGKEFEKYNIPEGSQLILAEFQGLNTHGETVFIDQEYIRADIVEGLTEKIASESFINFYLNEKNGSIVTTKRLFHLEPATARDRSLIDVGDYNCVGVAVSQSFNKDGEMFVVSFIRYNPKMINFSWQIRW